MAFYFNRTDWSFSSNPPGAPVPAWVVLLATPLLGLALVVFLPVVGFWLVGKHLVVGCARGMAALLRLLHSAV